MIVNYIFLFIFYLRIYICVKLVGMLFGYYIELFGKVIWIVYCFVKIMGNIFLYLISVFWDKFILKEAGENLEKRVWERIRN